MSGLCRPNLDYMITPPLNINILHVTFNKVIKIYLRLTEAFPRYIGLVWLVIRCICNRKRRKRSYYTLHVSFRQDNFNQHFKFSNSTDMLLTSTVWFHSIVSYLITVSAHLLWQSESVRLVNQPDLLIKMTLAHTQHCILSNTHFSFSFE